MKFKESREFFFLLCFVFSLLLHAHTAELSQIVNLINNYPLVSITLASNYLNWVPDSVVKKVGLRKVKVVCSLLTTIPPFIAAALIGKLGIWLILSFFPPAIFIVVYYCTFSYSFSIQVRDNYYSFPQ